MRKEKYFIIAAGGYLPKPVVQEIVVDEEEMDEDFVDFDDYKDQILEESSAEFDQRFAGTIILTEVQAKEVGILLTSNVSLPKDN